MNAKLLGARERNSSAYIKIKTNRKRRKVIDKWSSKNPRKSNMGVENVEDTLIVPVEVSYSLKIVVRRRFTFYSEIYLLIIY